MKINTDSGKTVYPITEKQAGYLTILFLDCGFTLAQRKDFLKLRFNKEFLDDLTKDQASKAIGELKDLKETQRSNDSLVDE